MAASKFSTIIDVPSRGRSSRFSESDIEEIKTELGKLEKGKAITIEAGIASIGKANSLLIALKKCYGDDAKSKIKTHAIKSTDGTFTAAVSNK